MRSKIASATRPPPKYSCQSVTGSCEVMVRALAGRVVADRKDKVDRRRIGRRELVPALAAQAVRRQIHALQELERERVHLPFREAARAKAPEPAFAQTIQQRLGQDAAR